MMKLVAPRLLIQVEHPCYQVSLGGKAKATRSRAFPFLGPNSEIQNYHRLAGEPSFASLRIGWEANGLHLWAQVKGKSQDPTGDGSAPLACDGLTLWIDTRESRQSHRATTFCHQFHFLATGGGQDKKDPVFVQGKIHRALEDAPIVSAGEVPFQCRWFKGGYEIQAFLSAGVLHGFDPESNKELGFFFRFFDQELGEETLLPGVSPLPCEDPTLWEVLKLNDSTGPEPEFPRTIPGEP